MDSRKIDLDTLTSSLMSSYNAIIVCSSTDKINIFYQNELLSEPSQPRGGTALYADARF
jgi:hypothetical protein